ncbi:MAG: ABC transporter permease subunit [Anaerolineales bacterium]|nr:ABC transporter permease subunit [Anaerolineales bacterium]
MTITRLTLKEAVRRKIIWAGLALGLLFLVVYGLGFHFVQQDIERSIEPQGGMGSLAMREIYNFLLLAGLYAVNFMVIAMSVLISIDTLSGEITSGAIQTLVTKPNNRWQIVIGKWLGFVVMLTLYVLMMAGGTMLLVYSTTSYLAPNALQAVALLWLNGMLILSLSFWGGSRLTTLANGVVAIGFYGVAFVGGWVEHIGAFLGNEIAVNIGILSSLIFPSEAVWRRLVYMVQSPLVRRMGVSPFTSNSIPSPVMIYYTVIFAIVLLFWAMYRFERRDL